MVVLGAPRGQTSAPNACPPNKTARMTGPCLSGAGRENQSPNGSFWRSSRRSCASSDSVAVGPREQTRNADQLAGFFAPAVVAGLDALRATSPPSSAACARGRGVRSSRACSSSIVARSAGSGTITVSRRFSVVWSGIAGEFPPAAVRGLILEESELILVHVILVAHLQDFGFGQKFVAVVMVAADSLVDATGGVLVARAFSGRPLARCGRFTLAGYGLADLRVPPLRLARIGVRRTAEERALHFTAGCRVLASPPQRCLSCCELSFGALLRLVMVGRPLSTRRRVTALCQGTPSGGRSPQ